MNKTILRTHSKVQGQCTMVFNSGEYMFNEKILRTHSKVQGQYTMVFNILCVIHGLQKWIHG